jgi:hypothetical protein
VGAPRGSFIFGINMQNIFFVSQFEQYFVSYELVKINIQAIIWTRMIGDYKLC